MTRPLRILVVQNVPHNLRGGMSRMIGFIHDRVAQDGHEIEFFSSEQVPDRCKGRRARFAFPWLALQHARRAASAGRPFDVINIHEPSAWAIVAFKKWIGDPIIAVTTHGIEERGWQVTREDARLGRDRLRVRTRLIHPLTVVKPSRYALRRADHVFCLNEDDRAFLCSQYRQPTERVTRMFPAADSVYLNAFANRDYPVPPTRLLWFGTWLVRKGKPDAVAAFTILAERFPDLKLIVMGAGAPEDVVIQAFPEHLRNRIEYIPATLGANSPEYVSQILRASVYLLPSVFEGTPLTLLETMATGLPPVTTAVCGMKDVVRDGENGLLVSPRSPASLADAVAQLLMNHPLRERLGRQAHADVATHYSWDQVAEPVRAVYRRFANSRLKGIS